MEHEGCKGCAYESRGQNEVPCLRCKKNATDSYKRMTNADRIRAMSNEELAELLKITVAESGDNLFYCSDYENSPSCKGVACKDCGAYLEWLKQEVKE